MQNYFVCFTFSLLTKGEELKHGALLGIWFVSTSLY